MALGHPVGAGVEVSLGVRGAGCPKTGGQGARVVGVQCLLCQDGVSCHHSCLEGLGHSSSPCQEDLTWCW